MAGRRICRDWRIRCHHDGILPIGLLGTIAADLHVSIGTAGLMVALPGVVAAIAAPTITLLTNKVDRRLLLTGSCRTRFALERHRSPGQQLHISSLWSSATRVSVGGFWTFTVAAGRRLVPEVSGGRATAVILAGISIGTVIGVPIGTALGALAGWRFAFGSVAARTTWRPLMEQRTPPSRHSVGVISAALSA